MFLIGWGWEANQREVSARRGMASMQPNGGMLSTQTCRTTFWSSSSRQQTYMFSLANSSGTHRQMSISRGSIIRSGRYQIAHRMCVNVQSCGQLVVLQCPEKARAGTGGCHPEQLPAHSGAFVGVLRFCMAAAAIGLSACPQSAGQPLGCQLLL